MMINLCSGIKDGLSSTCRGVRGVDAMHLAYKPQRSHTFPHHHLKLDTGGGWRSWKTIPAAESRGACVGVSSETSTRCLLYTGTERKSKFLAAENVNRCWQHMWGKPRGVSPDILTAPISCTKKKQKTSPFLLKVACCSPDGASLALLQRLIDWS